MGGLIDIERKGCEWIIDDHDRGLWVAMYRIVTEVTSDISVPWTYLVGSDF